MATAVVVHDLGQAEAALAAAAALKQPIAIWSAAGRRQSTPASAGSPQSSAGRGRRCPTAKAGLHPRLRRTRRSGAGRLSRRHQAEACFTGRPAVAARLADIARKSKARLHRKRARGPGSRQAAGISRRRCRGTSGRQLKMARRLGYSKRPIRRRPATSSIKGTSAMKMTPRVRKILSYYESDNPGTKANLARILMQGRLGGTGRLVILPVDQGFEHGPARSFAPNPPAYDPHYHFQLALDAGLSAYASVLGMIEAGCGHLRRTDPADPEAQQLQQPGDGEGPGDHRLGADALRLGCSAIGFTIYPGADAAFDQMEEIRDARRGSQGLRPRRRHLVLSARRHLQGGRDRHRHHRLCRPYGGPAGRPYHQGEAADGPSRAGRGQEGL